ncbi:ATP-dependent helicase [Alcaligenaceae bacterium C4P045]|nr:ATP-dependent helicase [Alcaligenaceae bacterium C4P045]
MDISAVRVKAFTGGAGCGKTHQLMLSLNAYLEAVPLSVGQKVLALTFMHGSRRRLEERLGQIPTLQKRSDCSTIDSFAWRLVRRWQSLAAKRGHVDVQPNEYDRVCDAAGSLLQIEEVQAWVAATFPILLVDEAQDLTHNRLYLIQGLAQRMQVFAAADEFQCLDEQLRPNPACCWLDQISPCEELLQPQRTDVAELLQAAASIRAGAPPESGRFFKVQLTPTTPLAGAWINSNLCWYGGGKSVAVISPAYGSFAKGALAWSASNKTSKGAGPYKVEWEESDAIASSTFAARLALHETNDIRYVAELLGNASEPGTAREVLEWMDTQSRTRAKRSFQKEEIIQVIHRIFGRRRRDRKKELLGWRGMTVHGAKNREFDNVIVIWPAAVAASDEQKRRLLYNAVTRAKSRCIVLVQATAQLKQAPFT